MIDEKLMRFEEKAVFALRSLYCKYGYLPYKMNKFEEYELYMRNKDFLVSDRVIVFNDTNGQLMALKPDVTLSIIKNGEDTPLVKQKVFYNENVYRVAESTHRFKEIMQTGLECIGDVDIYDIYEVINLAAESLSLPGVDFYIEVSNLDIVRSVVAKACKDEEFIEKAIGFISEKNKHDLKRLCDEYSVSKTNCENIELLISSYGNIRDVIAQLEKKLNIPELDLLRTLADLLDRSIFGDRVRIDFSIVNDMNYYNGFVFRGFLDGICSDVLSGGQYDNMMKKMNRKSKAVGFALYLDMLGDFNDDKDKYDVDYLLVYDSTTSVVDISARTSKLIAAGYSVSAQKCIPEKMRYKNVMDLRKKVD